MSPERVLRSRAATGYALNQCALYKLKNKRKLARLFHTSIKDIDNLLKNENNYRIFQVGKHSDGKPRLVEWPKPYLERLHRRILMLLQRIQSPPYLHSGTKGRSYITNAKEHVGLKEVVKLDIRKFYPSTKSIHVYRYFNYEMQCSSDVAGLITKIITCGEHIPTGSCVSQLVAFLVHKKLFDEVYALSKSSGITMTCYVDDLTFSGSDVSGEFVSAVKGLIRSAGLKHHKEKRYARTKPKLVTGVVVTRTGIRVRNRLLKKIHDGFAAMAKAVEEGEELTGVERLIGQINAANEISQDYRRMKRRAEGFR